MSIDFTSAATVQCIGECMIEIRRTFDDSNARNVASIAYSGDTYNTAVYLTRMARSFDLAIEVRYLSGVGHDDESKRMRDQWVREGVADDSVAVAGHKPGLYLITTDSHGERAFTYWRKGSAAAALFGGNHWLDRISGDVVYLSGITLQLMTPDVRGRLIERLRTLRQTGTLVALDTNFRPSGWASASEARAAMDAALRVCDLALVTLDDEVALGGVADVASCALRLCRLGVREAVIKLGPGGACVSTGGEVLEVRTTPVAPTDTTAAGDSFNGGYLAARIAGLPPLDAAQNGNAVARRVVEHPGAIVPADRMPAPALHSD